MLQANYRVIDMPYSLRPAQKSDLEPMMRIGHEGLRPYIEPLWGGIRPNKSVDFVLGWLIADEGVAPLPMLNIGWKY